MNDCINQKVIDVKNGNHAAFEEVFSQYSPIVLKTKSRYYLKSYELDDWLQEGRYVCYQSILTFDCSKNVTFGLYFKINFDRHICSLIRKQQAKKRSGEQYVTSLDSRVGLSESLEYYNVTEDKRAEASVNYIYIRDQITTIGNSLSELERATLRLYMSGNGVEDICHTLNIELKTATYAINRAKSKIKNCLAA